MSSKEDKKIASKNNFKEKKEKAHFIKQVVAPFAFFLGASVVASKVTPKLTNKIYKKRIIKENKLKEEATISMTTTKEPNLLERDGNNAD